jgi:hypothetical protein
MITAGSAIASHDQGRTASMLENFFSVAAKQKVLPTGVAMCRLDITKRQRSCDSDDFIAGVKSSSLDRVDFLVLKLCPFQLIRQSFLCFLFLSLDLLGIALTIGSWLASKTFLPQRP